MNIYDVREHNLEAHFFCNRTGALCQAEWSSHLRKLRMPFFLNSGWNPFSVCCHIMYCTNVQTNMQTHKQISDTHNFKESFPNHFPEFTAKPKLSSSLPLLHPPITSVTINSSIRAAHSTKHLSINTTLVCKEKWGFQTNESQTRAEIYNHVTKICDPQGGELKVGWGFEGQMIILAWIYKDKR